MNDAIRGYLLSVIAAALLATLVGTIFPKGSAKRSAEFVCGLLLILVIVGPFAKADFSVFPQTIAKSFQQAEQTRNRVRLQNRDLTCEVIKRNAEAYILDKAAQRNLKLTVEVEMEGLETYPYPAAVRIRGYAAPREQAELKKIIARELAIPPERQEWIAD